MPIPYLDTPGDIFTVGLLIGFGLALFTVALLLKQDKPASRPDLDQIEIRLLQTDRNVRAAMLLLETPRKALPAVKLLSDQGANRD